MQPNSHTQSLSDVRPVPRLREWRDKRELSQQELADRSGVSRHTIMALERQDGRDAWPQTVRKLAKALRVRTDQLH